MSVRPLRTWESDDPGYRWAVVVGGEYAPAIEIHTDDVPSSDQARVFAAAIVEACDYWDSGHTAVD